LIHFYKRFFYSHIFNVMFCNLETIFHQIV